MIKGEPGAPGTRGLNGYPGIKGEQGEPGPQGGTGTAAFDTSCSTLLFGVLIYILSILILNAIREVKLQ